jgi:hypothetical protein
MTAELYGLFPSSEAGGYFNSTYGWWPPIQLLISMSCEDFLTPIDLMELDYDNGYEYDEDKAEAIADRLSEIAANAELLGSYENQIKAIVPDAFAKCWSKELIFELIEFLRNCGGFALY